jgi:hypothetical protein
MGRPKKVENSKSRSFLLPRDLLDRLEESARMRGIEVSDAVRGVLEEGIEAYEKKSIDVHRRRMREAIAEVGRDPVLSKLFEARKGKKNLVLPLNLKLTKARLGLLLEALQAHQELEKAEEKEWVVPLLGELADEVEDDDVKAVLQTLDRLSGEGPRQFWVGRDPKGVFRFELSADLAVDIQQRQYANEVATKVRSLMDRGVLVKDGWMKDNRVYRFKASVRGA